MTKKILYLSFLFILFFSLPTYSQHPKRAFVKGKITGADNEALSYVTVYLKETSNGTSSDTNGIYSLNAPHGRYILVAHMIGYEQFEQPVELRPDESKEINIRLKEEYLVMDEVVITGKSAVRQINETAYNVVAMDAKALHNTTLDLAHALDRISGVKIKEVGGVGSDTQIALNGFSGKHVKIFMDGVPLDGSGSSLGLNNIPVNMAERIEVYKGVVPVELGADALGGAINIVTKNTANTYIDASYSYGSFNTHKSNLSFGNTTSSGYIFQLNAYQNYSDNSYKIKTNLLDLETNTYSKEEYWFKRFHDTYHNEAVIAKVGMKDKWWASRLILETTLSQEYAEIQNANLMKIVYGGKERKAKSIIPALTYEKKDFFTKNLNFSLTGRYNHVTSNNTDTLARQYNWNGNWRDKPSKGEGTYTLSESKNRSGYVMANLNYGITEKHFFTVNNVFNTFSRKASDAAANSETTTEATFMKRTTDKNIFGFAYKFHPSPKWNLSGFAKHYNVKVTGPVEVSQGSASSYELQNRSYNTTGYGFAGTYLFMDALQLKASFEKSYRLPSVNELFGDEVLETGDASLKPENSKNINFNISYDRVFNRLHTVYFDAGFVYRDTRDYIRRQIEQRYGGAYYTNHGKVRNLGFDVEARYYYDKKLSIGGNLTWQKLTNQERYSATGQELIYYKDRMPNVPYLFSNIDMTYTIHGFLGKQNILSIGYNFQYVHEFLRNWESEGGDIIIPTQYAHDLTLNYALKNGRYNITFEAKNFTNELLYDNYSLQKPGRSFHLKLRYYFQKNRR